MKKLTSLIFVLLLLGCSTNQDGNNATQENRDTNQDLTTITQSPDFVNYPFGKPKSSEITNYRWNHLGVCRT